MPVLSQAAQSIPKPLFFTRLIDLDEYNDKNPRRWSVQKYVPRSGALASRGTSNRGKLLVCHDYKGGYTESPTSVSYTFNFWTSCDTFIYFSHHRVTIPPSGWITAAHRQGVKMLGTLIFEGGAEEDCLRLLVGKTPTGPNQQTNPTASIPLSSHYAKTLARLAADLGFDGWLLNFECPLQGGPVQTHLLSAWITILRRELKEVVGDHAQVIWYDSVIFTGHLRWQDRLNNFNLPFFLSSDTFFTNYTWPPHFPALSAQYFLSIDHIALSNPNGTSNPTKKLSDIFCGVDVWGRGSHGGGGYGCYKAIEHVQPDGLGLSVALFGQAWTWESREEEMERREAEKAGSGWEVWWEGERRLWVGPVSAQGNRTATVAGPGDGSQNPGRRPEPECPHGPPKPLTTFFPHLPPPNPVDLPFHTTFCPGVGREWFVGGLSVMGSSISPLAGFSSALTISPTSTSTPSSSGRKQLEGWTDIDKQTSLGDMVWPKPLPTWVGFGADEEIVDSTASLPNVESEICFDDAWLGGSSLRLRITSTEVLEEESFRCFQIPINSLSLSPQVSYVAHLTYKVLSPTGSSKGMEMEMDLDLDVGISIKVLEQVGVFREVTMLDLEESLIEGALNTSSWSKASIKFSVPADYTGDFVASIGVQLGFMTPEPSASSSPGPGYVIDMLVGQICVYQAPPPGLSPPDPRILYVDYDPAKETLQWGVGSSLVPPAPINLSAVLPDDPNPVWTLDTSRRWLPSFLYYNLYYQLPKEDGSYEDPTLAKFYASTRMEDGEKFGIDRRALEGLEGQKAKARARFYVQGVTDRGTLLELGKCCSLDVAF